MDEHLRDEMGVGTPPWMRKELEDAVLALDVMPSMRALMTAGPALKRSGIAGYNCSYLPIDSVEAFHEILYILMHGTGVGFSVERQFTGAVLSCMQCSTIQQDYVFQTRPGCSFVITLCCLHEIMAMCS